MVGRVKLALLPRPLSSLSLSLSLSEPPLSASLSVPLCLPSPPISLFLSPHSMSCGEDSRRFRKTIRLLQELQKQENVVFAVPAKDFMPCSGSCSGICINSSSACPSHSSIDWLIDCSSTSDFRSVRQSRTRSSPSPPPPLSLSL